MTERPDPVPVPRPAPQDEHWCACPDCRLKNLLARKAARKP